MTEAYKESRLTQEALGELCETSGAAVNGWFKPSGSLPNGNAMLRLPGALNVTPQWLFADQQPKRPGGSAEGQEEVRQAALSVVTEVRGALADVEERILRRGPTPLERAQEILATRVSSTTADASLQPLVGVAAPTPSESTSKPSRPKNATSQRRRRP